MSSIPTDPAKLTALARDPKTPCWILEQLAKLDLVFLKEEAARHPNADVALLLSLIPESFDKEGDRRVAAALLSNPITPGPALLSLAGLLKAQDLEGGRRENWPIEELALKILSHSNFPRAEAREILNSLHLAKSLRMRLAKRSSNEGVLEALMVDPSQSVRDLAANKLKSETAS